VAQASEASDRRVIPRYVFDTGALIAAERGKARAARFLQLVRAGRARILIPLPVVAEWWRGRTDVRDAILAASEVVASLSAAKAAGVALGRSRGADAGLTVDAVVMATAALADAIVVTGDPDDFERLAPHFPKVVVLSA
jgi:predicted nucleic acid-binding protein